jgi:hypothetical protein
MDITSFITAEMLTSLPGQVAIVMIFTQVLKRFFTTDPPDWVPQFVAIVIGVVMNYAIAKQAGMPPIDFMKGLLIALNGVLVGFSAMKAAEALKGTKNMNLSMPKITVTKK